MGARHAFGLVLTAAAVTVTRDFGGRTLSAARAAPGQSALMALRRVTHISTSYGGRFVQAIDGLAGDPSQGMAWLYFVNGIQANIGSADYTLHPGDREWWDYRYWNDLIQVPVAIGAWPEPFVHGYGGDRPAVSVSGPACAGQIRTALRRAGAHLVRTSPAWSVRVETFAHAASELPAGLWQGRGLTVSLDHGRVMVYRGRAGLQPDPRAHALITGRQPGPATGKSAEVVVAGDSHGAACAAAHTLAVDPGAVRDAYAVALDASGNVIAYGGRP